MKLLDGKVALVTGSGRGLGRSCSQILSREGATVLVIDINTEGGEETVQQIKDSGGEASFFRADISKADEVEAMVAAAVDRYGKLDCAINNAVLNIGRTPLAEIDNADWERSLQVNLTGAFFCMKYEIRAMLANGAGAIVNIGSGNEHSAKPGVSWYLAAKQGIYAMTKCATQEYASRGIRINAVSPGSMWTPLLREEATKREGHIELLSSYTPMGRLADPEEVAEGAVWLCTPRASYVTGHTLMVEGGAVLGVN